MTMVSNPLPSSTSARATATQNSRVSPAGHSIADATAELVVPRLEYWQVSRVAVATATNVEEPVAKVYIDVAADSHFLAGTYTGSNDSSDESVTLRPGQKLICVWTGADLNTTCTMSISGIKTA